MVWTMACSDGDPSLSALNSPEYEERHNWQLRCVMCWLLWYSVGLVKREKKEEAKVE